MRLLLPTARCRDRQPYDPQLDEIQAPALPAATSHDIATRMISMEKAHKAILATGGLNLGVAARIADTLPSQLATLEVGAAEIRVANPSGLVSVGAEVGRNHGHWQARNAVLFRTARRLMQGEGAVPNRLLGVS
jgi:hypothetical protein